MKKVLCLIMFVCFALSVNAKGIVGVAGTTGWIPYKIQNKDLIQVWIGDTMRCTISDTANLSLPHGDLFRFANPFNVTANNRVTFGSDTSGAGIGFYWDGVKYSLKTGGASGLQFSKDSTGIASTSFGGVDNVASGASSCVIGSYSKARQICGFASGYRTNALGQYSNSFNAVNKSFGDYSTTFGFGNISGFREHFVCGSYNDTTGFGVLNNWKECGSFPNAPIFTVANADSAGATRHNAMQILQNGNVGIGVNYPAFPLDVKGDIRVNGNIHFPVDSSIYGFNHESILVHNTSKKSIFMNYIDMRIIIDTAVGGTNDINSCISIGDSSGGINYSSATGNNTFIGDKCGTYMQGDGNTAYGYNALKSDSIGKPIIGIGVSNTALGASTLMGGGMYSNNTAIGSSAGMNASGSSCTFIGNGADINSFVIPIPKIENSISIGASTFVDSSFQIAVGKTNIMASLNTFRFTLDSAQTFTIPFSTFGGFEIYANSISADSLTLSGMGSFNKDGTIHGFTKSTNDPDVVSVNASVKDDICIYSDGSNHVVIENRLFGIGAAARREFKLYIK